MTVMGQINLRSRTGFLAGQPTRKLSLEGATASFKGEGEAVYVTNLSKTGMLLETNAPLSIGEPLQVLLPEGETCSASIIWANETIYACEFERSLAIAAIRKVQLQSPPETRVGSEKALIGIDENPAETLGARIKRLRRERGFAMVHFASRIGVSKPTLWKWENGTVFPRQNMIQTIARVLGVPEKELIYGSKRPIRQHEQLPMTVFESSGKAIAAKKAELANIIGVTPCRIRIMIEA